MFKQRSKGKGHPKCTNFCRYLSIYISKTNGLEENLTTPRDVPDIFPPKAIDRSGQIPVVFNIETKEFGTMCGADTLEDTLS